MWQKKKDTGRRRVLYVWNNLALIQPTKSKRIIYSFFIFFYISSKNLFNFFACSTSIITRTPTFGHISAAVYWWICSWRGLIYIFQELYRRVLGRWPLPVFHPFNPKVERNSQVILDDNYILLSCCSTTCFHSILISFRGPMYRKNKKAHHDLKRRRIWSVRFVVHVLHSRFLHISSSLG